MNTVKLIGNVGGDVEMKVIGDTKLASFSLATNNSYINKDKEEVKTTQWHQIKAWGKNAEVCEDLLKKGSFISIEGNLNYNEYTNKENQKVRNAEIIALKIEEVKAKAEVEAKVEAEVKK